MSCSQFSYIVAYVSPFLNHCNLYHIYVEFLCSFQLPEIMEKILHVAEKNPAARSIAKILSNGRAIRRKGLSKYNPLYLFDANFRGKQTNMIMTSVTGHLLKYNFPDAYNKSFRSVDPIALFQAPLTKECPEEFTDIKKILENEVIAFIIYSLPVLFHTFYHIFF